jgi:hypothetical protein
MAVGTKREIWGLELVAFGVSALVWCPSAFRFDVTAFSFAMDVPFEVNRRYCLCFARRSRSKDFKWSNMEVTYHGNGLNLLFCRRSHAHPFGATRWSRSGLVCDCVSCHCAFLLVGLRVFLLKSLGIPLYWFVVNWLARLRMTQTRFLYNPCAIVVSELSINYIYIPHLETCYSHRNFNTARHNEVGLNYPCHNFYSSQWAAPLSLGIFLFYWPFL